MDSSALNLLEECGEIQRRLFYRNFMTHNKVGEMMCVNHDETEDTIIFEKWQVNGVSFIATFCLLSEDSMNVSDKTPLYKPYEELLLVKTEQQRKIYEQFLEKLQREGTSLDQLRTRLQAEGEEVSHLDFKPYTREMLEDRLPAGKKTIMGDRNSNIEVLHRQKDIPNDLQRPHVNRYLLSPPPAIELLLNLKSDEELKVWTEEELEVPPKSLDISTTVPFMKNVIYVAPIIYTFPAKEFQVN